MAKGKPAPSPEPESPIQPAGGPLVPRVVVTIVTLVLTGAMVYSATQNDYKSMIVLALVVLFILGADLGAIIRGWRGGGQ